MLIQKLFGIIPVARKDIHDRLTVLLQHTDPQAVRRSIHALLQGTIGDQSRFKVGTWEHTAWQIYQDVEPVVEPIVEPKLEPGQTMSKDEGSRTEDQGSRTEDQVEDQG